MKKRALIVFLFAFILISSFLVLATNHTDEGDIEVDDSSDEDDLVDKAYDCLEEKIDEKECDELTTQELIFALLSVGECRSELEDEASGDNECWPRSNCDVKTTAQAMLALEKAGISTDDAEEWLLDQKEVPLELEWYLQIESSEETTCAISYDGRTHHTVVKENKKIDSSAGNCLTISPNGYWLKISPTCFEEEFEVSCDESFQTNLLYKKKNSVTIYVAENTHASAADGSTQEEVKSYCFGKNSCDYEASLWAASVIAYKSDLETVSDFLPYLMTMVEGNEEYFPESFLYAMTGHSDYRNNILLMQKYSKYWDESGNKFYDTAVALYPFGSEEPEQKSNTIAWLLDPKTQGDDGCWDSGNIVNNAFILHSIWPRSISGGADPDPSCTASGYHCMSSADCSGTLLSGYDCPGMFNCCSQPLSEQTCTDQGGELCASNQICSGGTEVTASDADYSQICCYGGACSEPVVETACEQSGGTCSSFGCGSDETQSSAECDSGMDCCLPENGKGSSWGWVLILLLLILIVLVVIGFVFKDKLRAAVRKFKAKRKGGKSTSPPRGFPGAGLPPRGSRRIPLRRSTPRRIIPGGRRPPVRRPMPRRPPSSTDDVLKKLKSMGK